MKALFVCNTVYQVLVASWIKYRYLPDGDCDIVLSDHMVGSETVAKNMRKANLFRHVLTVNSKKYVYGGERVYNTKLQRWFYSCFPNQELKRYLSLKEKYDVLYIANYDLFNALVFDVLKRRNRHMRLFVFEDGLSTYSVITKQYYDLFDYPNEKRYRLISKYIFRKKFFQNNVDGLLLFEKKLSEWNPDCPVEEIGKINCSDETFKRTVNTVFDYDNLEDRYEEKYIFFEESYYAESGYMEDVKLIEQLALTVGKENLIIKIHPRNPVNRFQKLGYKTNVNISVPWEIIAMNMDLSGKKLVTFLSSSIINPVLVFHQNIRAYSLLELLDQKPASVNQDFSRIFFNALSLYPDNYTICSDIRDVLGKEKEVHDENGCNYANEDQ